MKILDRFIVALFGKFFLTILAALIALYALIDFVEKVDDFIEHSAGLEHYLLFPIFNLPLMLSNTLPMAILLGAFATIGSLSRTSQLTAISGSGISFGQISRPLFLCGALLSTAVFLSNTRLMPLANREANYLLDSQREPSSTGSRDLFLRDGQMILEIGGVFLTRAEITGITLLEFNDEFALLKRIEAGRGHYRQDGRWMLEDVQVWTFSEEDRQVLSFVRRPEQLVALGKSPDELIEQWQNPADMTLAELLRRADQFAAQGHDARPLRIEIQTRLAKSVTPMIMVLLGIPFALQRGRQASFALSFITSLVIFMVYFLLQAIMAAFAHAGILSPGVAAWSTNLLLGLLGSWLFLRMQN